MEIFKNKYSITELSKQLNMTAHTLRYYEKEFDLPISKDERGRRCYTQSNAALIYQIKNMRDDGLEMKAIKNILISKGIIPDDSIDETSKIENYLSQHPPADPLNNFPNSTLASTELTYTEATDIVCSESMNMYTNALDTDIISNVINTEINKFFCQFREQLTTDISSEMSESSQKLSSQISKELLKTKLELGACVENSARKIESKMDKHFTEVDRLLGNWRDKHKKNLFTRLFKR